jgi:protein-L-isoaspartate(D-aspartate) O-methyltransferase
MAETVLARDRMVDAQLRRRGIRDSYVLDAMRRVPRETFVSPGFEEFAYEDSALPIEESQTISQPYIVARMIEAAEVRPGARVLEVGAGSGYAAAVLSQIADQVFAIERHAPLGEIARCRFEKLGYDNIDLRVGDGTRGWAEAAPFDAILVSAGGPSTPSALKQQLAIGGRLVIPVGREAGNQTLLKLTRIAEDQYEEESLGSVRFVPLIGEHGWAEPGALTVKSTRPTDKSLPEMIAEGAVPLPDIDDPQFGALFGRFAGKRIVLLGEASHGTSEFYRARAAISRHFIERHGFTIVAVEADWPDAASIDRYVRHRPRPDHVERPFQRFPEWMWKNTDVLEFVEWLRSHNGNIDGANEQAGFYGLDLYNMNGSIAAVLAYLDKVDPAAAKVARERYGCLTPWQREPATYGRAVLTAGYRKCEEAVVRQCHELLERKLDYQLAGGDSFLYATENARVVASAEEYYRVMYYGGAESWNLRDRHMFDTLKHVLDARGPSSKAIVWAHNSHIGDARHTEMGAVRGELNIGQLCREEFGSDCALIGFGTHGGTVAAASDWDGDMEVKRVRPSREDSYERLCHDSGVRRFLLDLGDDQPLRQRLLEPRLERFIGVIYRPETERMSHYAEASLAQQFDGFVWFDETSAVTPLGKEHHHPGPADTFPFGM